MADLINQMQEIMCTSCTECEANWCDGKDREECKWMQKIAEAGVQIEAEIRAKAIDDFVERLKPIIDEKIKGWTNSDDLRRWCTRSIDEIAEELKGGGE